MTTDTKNPTARARRVARPKPTSGLRLVELDRTAEDGGPVWVRADLVVSFRKVPQRHTMTEISLDGGTYFETYQVKGNPDQVAQRLAGLEGRSVLL